MLPLNSEWWGTKQLEPAIKKMAISQLPSSQTQDSIIEVGPRPSPDVESHNPRGKCPYFLQILEVLLERQLIVWEDCQLGQMALALQCFLSEDEDGDSGVLVLVIVLSLLYSKLDKSMGHKRRLV